MDPQRVLTLSGLNLKVNPLVINPGEMIRCINMETDYVGGKKKRPGYGTYQAGSLGTTVTKMFTWRKNNGTQFWNYACAGGSLFYSTQGTGAWTICGGGTLTNGARPGNVDIQGTLMMIGDGTAATRHTTNGTSFTNTTSAPASNQFVDYQNRVYAMGTLALHWSVAGSPTDWSSADSSSINLPGVGRPLYAVKSSDRVNVGKSGGNIYSYDGYNLYDLSTNLAYSSPYSIGDVEGFKFGLNRLGYFGFNANKPEIISNPIERQIYNDRGSGITGGTFDLAPGIVHRYDYLCSVGTVTEDLTDETINNLIHRYDFQLDQWDNWDFANLPTAFGTFTDVDGNNQLLFGDNNGQTYVYGGTTTSDAGNSISSVMEFVIHAGAPETKKRWEYLWFFTNPGNEAYAYVACVDAVNKRFKNYKKVGQLTDGFNEYRFEAQSSTLCFVKIVESSRNSRFQFNGFAYKFTPEPRR